MKKRRDVCELPVMKKHCKTCPFKPNRHDGSWQDRDLANTVIERTLFKAQQICHGTEGKNRVPNNRCKGAFEYAKEIYTRMGYPNMIVAWPRKLK